MAVLGLCCISSIGGKPFSKGLLSGMIGLFVAMIGMDPQSGAKRFTFGNINLLDGIQLVPALMGLFGVCAVLKSADKFRTMSRYDTEKMPDVKGVWIGWAALSRRRTEMQRSESRDIRLPAAVAHRRRRLVCRNRRKRRWALRQQQSPDWYVYSARKPSS